MKKKLLAFIVCPECKGGFSFDPFSTDEDQEVMEGRLQCEGCGRLFPIIEGVPRLLPDALKDLLGVHNKFFKQYRSKFRDDYLGARVQENRTTAQLKKTSLSFGFEWTTFSKFHKEWEDNFQGYVKPLRPSFFQNRLGLDVGCGTGRHLYFASTYGSEMVGVDVSEGVQTAFKNTRSFDKTHVVQADLHHLPFNIKSFDFVYSFGVLHHLPEPEKGFKDLLPFLKPKGHMMIYVYSSYREESKMKYFLLKGSSFLRRFTTRLPLKTLYRLCYPLALALYSCVVIPQKIAHFLFPGQRLTRYLPFEAYRHYPIGVLHNDLFDRFSAPIENRYTKTEVRQWFGKAGLNNIQVVENYGWVGHGDVPE